MNLNSEIYKYISKTFLFSTGIIILLFASIIFIGDTVEFGKKLSSNDKISTTLIFILSSLNLPKMLLEILPFCFFFSGMLWVIKVSGTKELIVMRTTGLTIRKIILPIFLVSTIIGLFFVIIFSPLISATQKKILSIEADVLGKPINSILVTNSGFWVKQGNIDGNDMIYAKSLDSKTMQFNDVIVFNFNKEYEVKKKIKAESSELFENYWLLKNTEIINNLGEVSVVPEIKIPTSITKNQIKEGFSSPDSLSLWSLIPFIKMFESAGFSAKKHRYHLYKLFSFPFLLASMSLLGVSFNLNNFARKKTNFLFLVGIITGFFIFYITKIINALSLAGKMPLLFGSMLPIILPLFLAIALIIHADEK